MDRQLALMHVKQVDLIRFVDDHVEMDDTFRDFAAFCQRRKITLEIVSEGLDFYVRYLFFFQAEDGIRDLTVTGVQTCALPICDRRDTRGDPLEPSRIDCGIERIASRVATITTGRMRSASVRPAERMLCPKPNW